MADAEYPTIWDGYLESGRPRRVTPIHDAASARNRPQTYPPGPRDAADVDSYDLTNPDYDPTAWYTAVSGSDKMSDQISLRLPRYLTNVLDELCARRVFPAVKTRADFIRSSLVHELYRRVAEVRDSDFHIEVSAHTHLEMANALLAEHEAKAGFVKTMQEMFAAAVGDPYETRRALDLLWGGIDSGKYAGPILEQLEELGQKYGIGYHKPRIVD
jgi:hypothetical protein